MNEFYNKHYIRVGQNGDIIKGFSDAFEQPLKGDLRISDEGSYQFRLFADGEENPPLRDRGVWLYRYAEGEIIAKTSQEIEAERPSPAQPLPTVEQRLTAIEATLLNNQRSLNHGDL